MKKFFSLLLSAVIIVNTFAILSFTETAYAVTYAQTLKNKGFPDSYIPYLVTLHEKYPNWVFEPVNTGLDWQTAVNGERSSHSKQLIEKCSLYSDSYYCNCSSCYKNGSYVIREGNNWVAASETAVKYYMDPRNFLTEQYIFQFESTAYDGTQSKTGVESILNGTWMHDSLIRYTSTKGEAVYYDNSTKYSDAIMQAATASNMSAYYLASKIRQENGGKNATAISVKGTASPFIGTYNYYNIGANSGAYEGLAFAAGYLKLKNNSTLYSTYDSTTKTPGGKTTKLYSGQYMVWISTHGNYFYVRLYTENSSNSYTAGKTGYVLRSDIRTDYTGGTSSPGWARPWSNPYKSIKYGAMYISQHFQSQNTGYLQKFNVSPSSSYKYSNEYMANVAAAAAESKTTYNAYKTANILSLTKKFEIPVYNNMPADANAKTGWQKSGSNWYYYGADGSLTTGWKQINNVWYYFNSSGVMQTGWVEAKSKWYYFDSSGAMQTGWLRLNNAWYYLTDSGAMQTGWATINDARYYFNDNGKMKAGCWFKYNDRWYYFNDNGKMKSEVWFLYKNEWYYFNKCGTARLGWFKYKNNWYYFDSPNANMAKGWRTYKNEQYYMNEDGIMQTGWLELDGSKYYLKDSGAASVKNFTVGDTTYLADYNGAVFSSYAKNTDKVNLKTVTSSASRSIDLTWDKPAIPNSGYQIMWSTTKDFSKDYLVKTCGYSTKLDYNITTGKSGRTYYVRVRAYKVWKNADGTRSDIYFPWSSTKSVYVK